MKKSQIFLGGSAFLLAIAGALATKASHKAITHLAGWTSSNGAVCHRLVAMHLTTVQNIGVTARTTAGNKTLYTATGAVGSTVCGKKLYTNPQN